MANTADEQRRRVHQIAEAIASTWERRRAYIEGVTAPVRRWLIRELAPREGDRVLELAAGAGDTGFEAAAIVGNDGRLVSTDFSAAMLDVARRRGAELGVRNVDYLEIDAERIGLDSSSVDGVLCRFGYMLMADPSAALAETERVLRPGGRVALAVWGRSEDNPFFELIGTALVEAGLMAPFGQDGPSPFSMASGQFTGDLLRRAGFADIWTEEVGMTFGCADVADYLDIVADTSGPMGLALQSAPDRTRADLAARLDPALARYATGAGHELPGVAVCAVAASPS